MKRTSFLLILAMIAAIFTYTKLDAYSDISTLSIVKDACMSYEKHQGSPIDFKKNKKQRHSAGFDRKFLGKTEEHKKQLITDAGRINVCPVNAAGSSTGYTCISSNNKDTSVFTIISPRK